MASAMATRACRSWGRAACCRRISPPTAAAELGAELVEPALYEAHRVALGVPRGGLDFSYGDAFPHETDMDQLGGVDFDKGCFVGQEVVSRIEHRGSARTRVVPVSFEGFAPEAGMPVSAGDKQRRHARLDRARPRPCHAAARPGRPTRWRRASRSSPAASSCGWSSRAWARFAFPGDVKAAG